MSHFHRHWFRLRSSLQFSMSKTHLAVLAIVLAIVSLSVTMFRSGAQELNDTTSKTRGKTLNLDIRANGGDELLKTVDRHAAGRDNFVADIGTMAREQALAMNGALERIRKQNPTAEVTVSELTGSVEVLRSAKTLTRSSFGR